MRKVKFGMLGDREGMCSVLYVVLNNNMVVV